MITISWAAALALLGVVALIAWIAGSVRGDNWRRQDFEQVVGYQRREATALRMLYAATGYEFPDDDNTEPEPSASRWQRIKTWWGDRMRPTPADPQPADDLEDDVEDQDEELEQEPTPVPIPPGNRPPVKPAALMPDDEWERHRDAMVAEMLAEIRGERVPQPTTERPA